MTSWYCFARLSSSGSSLGGSGCSRMRRITLATPLFYIRRVQGHWEVPVEAQVGILQGRAWLPARESEAVSHAVGHETPLRAVPPLRVEKPPSQQRHPTSLCSHSLPSEAWGDRSPELSSPHTVASRSW